MIGLLVATATAHVETMPCQPATPADSLPRNAAHDVPVDVVPAVVFHSTECSSAWTLVLTRATDGAEVGRTDDAPVDDGLVEVVPEHDLDPDTWYVLTATSERDASIVSFSTGSSTAGEHPGPPRLVTLDAAASALESEISVSATAEPASTDDTILLFLEEGIQRTAVFTSEGEWVTSAWSRGTSDLPRTRCVSVAQRDVRGEEVDSEETCELVCGCSAAGPSSSWIVAAASLLLVRRR